MAGRFPGAADVHELWTRVRTGESGLTTLSVDELRAAGVSEAALRSPNYVRRRGVLTDADKWDADFFGVAPKDAELTDPQHRLFLECAWTAIEDAGLDRRRLSQPVGVFAAAGQSAYLYHLLRLGAADTFGHTSVVIRNDKDYLAAWVAYKLGLHGPAMAIQTACSSSLVAVHVACQSLLAGDCDAALVGGVTVRVPPRSGYLYTEGSIDSPDGTCRPFDRNANGTIAGDGVGAVVLVRLEDALTNDDCVWALIASSAVSNDGANKVGFTAPGLRGQALAIHQALTASGRSSDEIGFVEAHGTGTPLGDPIEIRALTRAFATERREYCAIGSIKANVGHLDAAAGITGLIKAVLAVAHGEIPPHANFTEANPAIDFRDTPFYVPRQAAPWPASASPRCAGVSSFGIGGTNAHVILEQAPVRVRDRVDAAPSSLMLVSAKNPRSLDEVTGRLVAHLGEAADEDLSDVAFTLATGRTAFDYRRFAVAGTREEAVAQLGAAGEADRRASGAASARRVAFLFPGQQSLTPGCAEALYSHLPTFREWIDRASDTLMRDGRDDLRALLCRRPSDRDREWAHARLTQTEVVQPALFAIEFAMAQTWREYGVEPVALLGHSLGELVAAAVAGVFDFEQALEAVAIRGRLMQRLPDGSMWAVFGPVERVRAELDPAWDLAVINGPTAAVVSIPADARRDLEAWAGERGFPLVRLSTSHAFHSRMVEPVLADLERAFAGVGRREPAIPVISNVTGTWMTGSEALDSGYWARHARQPVRFDVGFDLIAQAADLLVEVGPGHTLTSLAARMDTRAVAAFGNPERGLASALEGFGSAWGHGAAIDWHRFYAAQRRRRVRLPTYPFQRTRYWYSPVPDARAAAPVADGARPVWSPVAGERAEFHADAEFQGSTDADGLSEIFVRQLAVMREQLDLVAEASGDEASERSRGER